MRRVAVFAVLAVVLLATTVMSFTDDELVNDVTYLSQLNKINKKWIAGHNKRFDGMTVKQIAKKFLGTIPPTSAEEMYGKMYSADQIEAMKRPSRNDIPTSFDSRQRWGGCIHPIRDQAHCGSCWAFSGSEVLSDRFCIATNNKTNVVLSPQDMVSCDTGNLGCQGGYLTRLWDYLKRTGVVPEDCFPYASQKGIAPACPSTCTDGSGRKLKDLKYKAKSYTKVGGTTLHLTRVEKIQDELMTNGPIQVAFSVYRDFISYKSGVYHRTSSELLGGHAVKLVGWGVDNSTPYWLIANSWNTTWGEDGFFRIVRGTDECGIESQAYTGTPDTGSIPTF